MYRTLQTSLWNDPKVRDLSPQGKLLFIYLITNSHTHVSGLYYLPRHYIAYDTGLKPQDVGGHLKILTEKYLIAYDDEKEIVWVVQMFLHQGRGTKNDQAAAIHLGSLHQTALIDAFLVRYPHVQQYMAIKPKTKRGHLPTNLRFAVLKRDDFTCQYCGSKAPDVLLEIDHKVPKIKGGTDTIDNLLTSCQQCNHGKGGTFDTLSQDTLSQDTLSDSEEIGYPLEQEQIQDQEQEQELKDSTANAVLRSAEETSAPPIVELDTWPSEHAPLCAWLHAQDVLTAIAIPTQFDWWATVSWTVNGMPDADWLGKEFSKMQLWLDENPKRKPTPRGTSRFIRGWLERAYEKERRNDTHPQNAPRQTLRYR